MTGNFNYAMEGLGKLDPELQWAAHELASSYDRSERENGRVPTVLGLTAAYCPTVADMVAERLGCTHSFERLSAKKAANIGSDALIKLDAEQKLGFEARIDLAARFVVAAAKMRAVSPDLSTSSETFYWPFGSEGGFCNPRKLQELED